MTNAEVIRNYKNILWIAYSGEVGGDWISMQPHAYLSQETLNSFASLKFNDGSIWDRNAGWRNINADSAGVSIQHTEPEYIVWHKDIWRDAYKQQLPTWFISIIMTHTFSIGAKDFLELESNGAIELVPGMIIRRNKLK